MGIKRIVDTSFWTDGKVDEFTPEDKYFMLYLLTNPFSTQLGIYEISIKQVAFHLGYSVDAVKSLIERFENNYEMIVFSKPTNEIAIKNFLRHSIIKGGAPVRDCLIKEMKKVKNKDLISIVFAHIKGSEDLNETVKNIIAEYEEKNGTLSYSNEKHNDNENENDVSYPDSSHVSCDVSYNVSSEEPKKPVRKKKEKPQKHSRGEFQHVLLTDDQEDKLIEEYGLEFTLKAITFLDEYIEENKETKSEYKKKNHYLCIKRWVIDAVKEKEEKAIKKGEAPRVRYGNFDTQEVFDRAVARSLAEFKAEAEAEPKTAGNDPVLRERVQAMKEKLS